MQLFLKKPVIEALAHDSEIKSSSFGVEMVCCRAKASVCSERSWPAGGVSTEWVERCEESGWISAWGCGLPCQPLHPSTENHEVQFELIKLIKKKLEKTMTIILYIFKYGLTGDLEFEIFHLVVRYTFNLTTSRLRLNIKHTSAFWRSNANCK